MSGNIQKNRVSEILDSFKDKRIAVVGDMILDVYIWGDAKRISQEAPVPVVSVRRRTERLGGAANVLCNIAALGGTAVACGLTGDDADAGHIARLMNENAIESAALFADQSRPTTRKTRVIAASQQLVRIDNEETSDASRELRGKIIDGISAMISDNELDAVILEDYAKGLLDSDMAAEITEIAKKFNVPVALDPHPGHPLDISGISIMTPNRSEACGLARVFRSETANPDDRMLELEKVAGIIQDKWNPDHLLITLGADGMALFSRGAPKVVIPTMAMEVFDVSGAGDTVIAAFTMSIVSGASPLEAAKIANHAAGAVVAKIGTVSVTPDEILATIEE
ncbi:MAG: D-glycero-beta-D-manno-heptose-7-phosphate kinase [Kiritimatiellaeota bacterium]|nr:D-glycero-beta-D-manno-heptose-7-phosphate kinase [Kiritimatiellota bacterium]